MSVIEFKNVYKSYSKMAPALKKISFTIKEGEFLALSGPSGSGKTTILNLAAGIDRPSKGKILLLGHSLSKLTSTQVSCLRKRRIGFVFQSFNLFPVLTVLENVEFTLALNKVPPAKRRKMAKEALSLVGLMKLARRFPNQLSGGQQQRVAVARAVVSSPRLIFADEPTANLDSQNALQLLKLFKKLNEEKSITFVFSSHDRMILSHANRILEISDGAIKQDTYLKNEDHEQNKPKKHIHHSKKDQLVPHLGDIDDDELTKLRSQRLV